MQAEAGAFEPAAGSQDHFTCCRCRAGGYRSRCGRLPGLLRAAARLVANGQACCSVRREIDRQGGTQLRHVRGTNGVSVSGEDCSKILREPCEPNSALPHFLAHNPATPVATSRQTAPALSSRDPMSASGPATLLHPFTTRHFWVKMTGFFSGPPSSRYPAAPARSAIPCTTSRSGTPS